MNKHMRTVITVVLTASLVQQLVPTAAFAQGEVTLPEEQLVTEEAAELDLGQPEVADEDVSDQLAEAEAAGAPEDEATIANADETVIEDEADTAGEAAPEAETTEEPAPQAADEQNDPAPAEEAPTEIAPAEETTDPAATPAEEPPADPEPAPTLTAQQSVDGFISYNLVSSDDSQTVTFKAPLTGYYTFANSENSSWIEVEFYDIARGASLGSISLHNSEAPEDTYVHLEKGAEYNLTFTAYGSNATGALSLNCVQDSTIESFVIEDGVVTGYTGAVMNIQIPEGVTSISAEGYEAIAQSDVYSDPEGYYGSRFSSVSLTFPSTMTEISAEKLNYYNMGKSAVRAISFFVSDESELFSSSEGILYSKDGSKLVAMPARREGTVTVPEGVTTIGTYAFAYGDVTSVNLPDTLVTIEESAFENALIGAITLPDSVKTVDDRAFAYIGWSGSSSLKSVDLGNGVESIGFAAFENMRDTEIMLPASLRSLDTYAFEECPNLTTVTIEGETSIGDAFYRCGSLKKLVINGNAEFSAGSFSECPLLAEFEIGPDVTSWAVMNDCLIHYTTDYNDKPCTELAIYPATDETIDLVIDDTIDEVSYDALFNVADVESLVIGKNCRYLGGATEFNLSTITVAAGNKRYFVRDGVLCAYHYLGSNGYEDVYDKYSFDIVRFPMGSSQSEYVVPEDIEELWEDSFANYYEDTPRTLTRVSIPEHTKLYGDIFWSSCEEGETTLTIEGYEGSSAHTYCQEHGEAEHLAWEALLPSSVEIIFDGNGSNSIESWMVKRGDTLGTLPTTTRSGYKLLGWYTSPSGGTKISSTTVATKDATYFAHWQKLASYKVTFNANGGKSSKASVNVYSGYKIGTLPTATRSGYKFLGWYTAKTGGTKLTTSTKITKAQTVYAHWKKRVSVAGATVTVASPTYTGAALKPTVTVKVSGKTLVAGTDYKVSYANNVNASAKATVTVTGLGNYMGTKKVTFTIKARSVAKLSAALTKTSYAWTGKALKPGATVKYGTKKLVNGTDYTLTYKNNTNIGTATVTIKGKGNYTGSKALTFKITKATQAAKLSATTLRKYYTQFNGKTSMTTTVKITGAKESPKITFKSSNTKVAKVEKALIGYKVTIYRKAGASASANITFTVAATTHYKAKTLTLKVSSGDKRETPTVTMPAGVELKTTEISGTIKATATTDSDGKVTYVSSNANVAKVNAKGVVTLTGAIGEATITAKVAGTEKYKPASGTMRIVVKTPVQKALWFMDQMYITQVPGGDFSHAGTLNFDVIGTDEWGTSIVSNILAPFDCKIVTIYDARNGSSSDSANTVVIQSLEKVEYADGSEDYMTLCFGHDDDVSNLNIGDTFKQGEAVCQTGMFGNATGIHSHVTVIRGEYQYDQWTQNPLGVATGNWGSPHSIDPRSALFKPTNLRGPEQTLGMEFKSAD